MVPVTLEMRGRGLANLGTVLDGIRLWVQTPTLEKK